MTPNNGQQLDAFLAREVLRLQATRVGGVQCWEGEPGLIRATRWEPRRWPGQAWGVVLAMLGRGAGLALEPRTGSAPGAQARFAGGEWREHRSPLAALCMAAGAALEGGACVPAPPEPAPAPGGPGWWWYLWRDRGEWKRRPVEVLEDGRGLYLEGKAGRVPAADLPGRWWGPLPTPPLPARPLAPSLP